VDTDGEVGVRLRTRHDGRRRSAAAWAAATGAALAVSLVCLARARRGAAQSEGVLRTLRDELEAERAGSRDLVTRLRAEARTDPLTGLANLRQWREQLERELERARRSGTTVAVAVVDLDRFKAVNDGFGHATGDALLRDVAARFAASVRTVDLVARIGGEEFAVALPDVSEDDAVVIVERLRTSLAAGHTGSAGLAVWDGTESAEQLQSRADRALYRAKEQGRDRLVVA
jgi:diguanylate cyclase (GGDEF)-like protein